MVPEARLERADGGLTRRAGVVRRQRPGGELRHAEGRGARLTFEGDTEFPQVGVSLFVLAPGEPMGIYHWEADQEDFLVLSGEALLIVEGDGAALRRWDFVHCPVRTNHVIVGAGDGPAPCSRLARASTSGTKVGRLSRRGGRAAPRRGGRAGDQRRRRGLRGAADSQADGVPRRLAARRRAVLVAVREAPPGVGVNSICAHTDSKEPQRRCPKP